MSKLNSRLCADPDRRCKRRSGFLSFAIALMMAVFLVPAFLAPEESSADSAGYTTPSFDVNVVTDEDHVFHVSEAIEVDFYEYRHGIYRYIPDGGRYYGVKNVRVEGYDYEVYSESGNTVVQIGSPDYTVYGEQTYLITYDIVGYRDDSDDQDYLSLDLLPTGWGTEIGSADLRIEFPKEIKGIETYTGSYGSTGGDEYFKVTDSGTVYTAVSRGTLPKGVGLTIKADLPEGYWVDPYSRDSALMALCGMLAVMGMLMLLLWFAVGRDDPVIPTVEFYPPDGLDPLEMAYVANDEVHAKDISALFIYLADKGCIHIDSDGKKSFTLIKQKTADEERSHTRKIFNALFSNGRKTVRLKSLPSGFGEIAAKTPSEVKHNVENHQTTFSAASKAGRAVGLAFCLLIPLIAAGAHTWLTFGGSGAGLIELILALIMFVSMVTLVAKTDSFRTKKRPVRIVIGFIVFLAALAAEGYLIAADYPVLALVFACSELAAAIATIFVRRRMNNELFGRVLGFRDFIRTAEYDRLKMLSEENPDYYFNIMPYACIFGMSTKWADKFADFRIPPPAWYSSPAGTWDPYFGHHIYIYTGNNVFGAVTQHYRAVGSDILSSAVDSGGGGGGFSGGGFSGGGFGGGGGGSW